MTARSRCLRFLGVAGLGVLLLPGAPAQAATTAAAPAEVTVVHGVRGLVADVRVDGKMILSGFAPERVTDSLKLPAGMHRVQIWTAGAAASSKPVLDRMIPVTAGTHTTLGVGLDAQGNPQITAFDDDLAVARGGATALAVRDIAAAPSVRVTVDSLMLANGIQAPQQSAIKVAPGAHAVSVLPLAGTEPVVANQSVPVVAGRATVLYLIGSQKDGSLGWITQTLRPTLAAPASVQTGVGEPYHPGTTANRNRGLIALAGMGLLAVVLVCRRTWRWRAASEAAV